MGREERSRGMVLGWTCICKLFGESGTVDIWPGQFCFVCRESRG